MNKDPWIALIIASVITILAVIPLYYFHQPIGSKGKFSEGSGTKAPEPMKRTDAAAEVTMPELNNNE